MSKTVRTPSSVSWIVVMVAELPYSHVSQMRTSPTGSSALPLLATPTLVMAAMGTT